ncbi:MAG: hemerythrin family protein [Oscillospiraceae bacterium]|nr:hemerythrin family protein [Oscillospiraceae bacterium]
MNMEENAFEWKDEYNIGVESIDGAHRQLFRIVSRIINNFESNDFEKNKATCIEAIKYLKNYSIQHFADEEKYMLANGYRGYQLHKRVHDNMRNVVIPALEKEMELKSYSKESMENFLGVCAGWLSAHILIDDAAICGKAQSKWRNSDERSVKVLNDIIESCSANLFAMRAEVISRNYEGFRLDELFIHKDALVANNGTLFTVTTAIEYPMLKVIAKRFVKSRVFELDTVMQSMLSEMISSFNKSVIMAYLKENPMVQDSKDITPKAFYEDFEKDYPDYTMLWKTYCGRFAFTVRKETL